MRSLILVTLMIAASAAWARDPEGRLALLRAPHDGMPAVLLPGGSFETTLSAKAELRLVAAASEVAPIALQTEWLGPFEGCERGRCTVPADIRPGAYALEAVADGKADRNPRAVFVRAEFPESYLFLHLTDTHVGRNAGDGQPASVMLRKALSGEAPLYARLAAGNAQAKAVAGTPAPAEPKDGKMPASPQDELAFVVITGDLTDTSDPAQFHEFLSALDVCALPTFVCAGNHDRKANAYAGYFGSSVYTARFGKDGYLFFDTKDFLTADDAGAQAGEVALARRALKDCRWTVAATHRYEMSMGMRTQLALFVDDPVDLLIFGHWHRANTAAQAATPWGVKMVVTPSLLDGVVRPFRVRPQDVKGLEPMLLSGEPAITK